MDLLLPEMHGLEVLRRLKAFPHTRPIILSSHSNASYVIEALKNGAAGFLLKDNNPTEMFQAIRVAASGVHLISRELRHCAS